MTKVNLTVTVSSWIKEAIELKRIKEEKSRSELVEELLTKALKISVNVE